MTTSTQSSKKHRSILLLAGGLLFLIAIWQTNLRTAESRPKFIGSAPENDHMAGLSAQIRGLEEEVSQLRRNLYERQRSEEAVAVDAGREPYANEANAPSKGAGAEESDLSEEQLDDRLKKRVDHRYAFFEQRFSEEPVDKSGSVEDEISIRDRVEALDGYELSTVECRYTMCRLVVRAESGAAEVMRKLNFRDGGEIRRRDDGTFLIFAGREGFPFHQLNSPD